MSTPETPRRGEIWLAELGDAQAPSQIPALIISSNALAGLPLRLVAPLRPWEDRFAGLIWLLRVEADWRSQLAAPHAADMLQIRGLDRARLLRYLGRVPATLMDEVTAAIAIVIDHEP